VPTRTVLAKFIEPMLLVPSDNMPEGPNWSYEWKLDGNRAVAFKSYGVAHLRSRNDKSFDSKYPANRSLPGLVGFAAS
jgi:ATP-dependent DNA ligase